MDVANVLVRLRCVAQSAQANRPSCLFREIVKRDIYLSRHISHRPHEHILEVPLVIRVRKMFRVVPKFRIVE